MQIHEANILLQCPENLPVTVFAGKGRNNRDSFPKVTLKIVNDALSWLKQNNPLYKEIMSSQSRHNELPVDGNIDVSARLIDDSQSTNCGRGPVEENEEEVETSIFMPEKLSQPLEETKLEQILQFIKNLWIFAFNEISTQCLGALAFPSLFSKWVRRSNQ